MSRGVLYTYPDCAVQPLVYTCANYVVLFVGCTIYISAWGFGVARFDYDGLFLRASDCEASDSAGLHAFFVSNSGNE